MMRPSGAKRASLSAPRVHRATLRRGASNPARAAPGWRLPDTGSVDGERSRLFEASPGSPESRTLTLPGTSLCSVSSRGELALLIQRSLSPEPVYVLARAPLA